MSSHIDNSFSEIDIIVTKQIESYFIFGCGMLANNYLLNRWRRCTSAACGIFVNQHFDEGHCYIDIFYE